MKYYKSPAQEQMITKASPFELLNWVYSRKTTALMLHNYYREVLSWMGLTSLAKVQKCRFLSEYDEQIEIAKHMEQLYGIMPCTDSSKETLEIDTFKLGGKTSIDVVSKQDKEKILRRIMTDWKDWECETIDMLGDLAAELRKRCEISSAIFVEKLLEGTVEEVQMAKEFLTALQNINFSLENIYEVQDHVRMIREHKN